MIALLLILAAASWGQFQAEARKIAASDERLCAVIASAPVDAASLGGEWWQVERRLRAALGNRPRSLRDSLERDGRRAWLAYQSAGIAGDTGRTFAAAGLARSALAVSMADSARLRRATRCVGW